MTEVTTSAFLRSLKASRSQDSDVRWASVVLPLALAHYVERLVEELVVTSYADAVRQLGVSRARMTQILNLPDLPPLMPNSAQRHIHQSLLHLGDLHLSEQRVRAVAAGAEQRDG